MFIDRKLDELIAMFGSRKCCSVSVVVEADEAKELDPRLNRSFPLSPNLPPIKVDRNPKPLRPKQINNCYNESFFELRRRMKPLNGNGVNKATQKGGRLDDDLHRADSFLVSDMSRDEFKSARSGDSRKCRGRKTKVSATAEAVTMPAFEDSLKPEYLTSIKEEDEMLAKKRIISKKLKSHGKSSASTSPRKVIAKPQNKSPPPASSTVEERQTLQSTLSRDIKKGKK